MSLLLSCPVRARCTLLTARWRKATSTPCPSFLPCHHPHPPPRDTPRTHCFHHPGALQPFSRQTPARTSRSGSVPLPGEAVRDCTEERPSVPTLPGSHSTLHVAPTALRTPCAGSAVTPPSLHQSLQEGEPWRAVDISPVCKRSSVNSHRLQEKTLRAESKAWFLSVPPSGPIPGPGTQ